MNRYVVDTQAIVHNLAQIRRAAGGANIYAVLKGDAYGLGLLEMAQLHSENGVDRFAVTQTSEAEALRRGGFAREEILFLRSTSDRQELETLVDLGVVCTAGSEGAAMAIRAAAEARKTAANVHIEIDTGMGRTGFLPGDIEKIKSVYDLGPEVIVTGIYTHFHSAFCNKKATRSQYDLFMSVVKALQDDRFETGTVHAANSSALFRAPYAAADAVRVGSALLGRLSFRSRGNCGLLRVGHIETAIDSVRWLSAGSTIGYGAGCRLKKAARVAIVPVGYYHGFNVSQDQDLFRFRDGISGIMSHVRNIVLGRHLSVRIGGKEARVLGHVGMMHTAIDVTKLDCGVGSKVVMDAKPTMIKGLQLEYR